MNRPVDDYEEMVGDDVDLLEEEQLVPDSESDDSDDEQNQWIVGCHIGVCYDYYPRVQASRVM